MFLLDKSFLAIVASVLSIIGYVPYFQGIRKGAVKPHIFSWVIWMLLTGIVFVAQVQKGAGPGAWVTGVAVVLCLVISVMAYKNGDKDITRSDWVSFVCGLAAIPLWRLTRDPQWSVILVTFIYVAAYYPTFRKSFTKPWDEALSLYVLSIVKNMIGIMAIETFSLTTVLYPASTAVMNVAFIGMVMWRRAVLTPAAEMAAE